MKVFTDINGRRLTRILQISYLQESLAKNQPCCDYEIVQGACSWRRKGHADRWYKYFWEGNGKLEHSGDLFAFASFRTSCSVTSLVTQIFYKRKIIEILSRTKFLSRIYRCSSFESCSRYLRPGQNLLTVSSSNLLSPCRWEISGSPLVLLQNRVTTEKLNQEIFLLASCTL